MLNRMDAIKLVRDLVPSLGLKGAKDALFFGLGNRDQYGLGEVMDFVDLAKEVKVPMTWDKGYVWQDEFRARMVLRWAKGHPLAMQFMAETLEAMKKSFIANSE